MNISVQEKEYCKLFVEYVADVDTVSSTKEKIENEVVEAAKDQQIPGFRKGACPPLLVKNRFRKEIDNRVKQELVSDALQNLMFEKKLRPFGYPQFEKIELGDKTFNCSFMLHTYPEFQLKQYKEFEIPKPPLPAEEDMAQKTVQEIRERYGQTIPYTDDDFVTKGDTLVIDYKAFVGDELVENLQNTGEVINVGRTNVPGFDDNLLGMKQGDTREFVLKAPKSDLKVSEKDVRFVVTLTLGSKNTPAALDDELAKKLGMENMDQVFTQARAVASNRRKEIEKQYTNDQISRRLIGNHEFQVPSWISMAEAQITAKSAHKEWDKLSDGEKSEFIVKAENNIKLSLILEAIRSEEPEAQTTDEEVYKLAKENLSGFSDKPEEVLANLAKHGQLMFLFTRIRDDYTLGFIEKTCKIIE